MTLINYQGGGEIHSGHLSRGALEMSADQLSVGNHGREHVKEGFKNEVAGAREMAQ